MKKIMICVIFLLSIIILPCKISAGNMDSYIDWNLDRTVFAHQYRNGSDHITNLAMITANGKIAYCIEPGITADKGGMYNSTYNINETKLKNADVKKLSLIGYYGYGYDGHNSKEYYMATQELIWRLMGVENVWWTDSKFGGNTINIDSYKNEILSLVNSYEISPKFNFENKYIVGDEVILEDLNHVLDGYEENSDSVSINGNTIKIKVKETNNNFNLKRKKNGKNAIFYYKEGYQTIGSFEYAYDYSKNYDLVSYYGKIVVDKKDEDTKSKVTSSPFASLKNAEYTLYDSNEKVIDRQLTDENGLAVFDNLAKGTYYVKETKPSVGYNADIFKYKIYVSSSRMEVIVNSYEKIIKNKVTVNKVLDDGKNGIMIPEEKIEFGLYYDNGELIDTYITNKDGIIDLLVPYGKYVLKQLTTKEGISVADDTIIEVTKENENQNITIVNHKITEELPNTGKGYNTSYLFLILSFGFVCYYERKNI